MATGTLPVQREDSAQSHVLLPIVGSPAVDLPCAGLMPRGIPATQPPRVLTNPARSLLTQTSIAAPVYQSRAVRVLVTAQITENNNSSPWVLLHLERPDIRPGQSKDPPGVAAWNFIGSNEDVIRDGGDLRNTARRCLKSSCKIDLEETDQSLMDLGASPSEGTLTCFYALRLPKRTKISGASALAEMTQWFEMDEVAAMLIRGAIPTPLGSEFRNFITSTLRFKIFDSPGHQPPTNMKHSEWAAVHLVRESICLALAALGTNTPPPDEPRVAPLFWVSITVLDKKGRRQRLKALIDSGSQMDVISRDLATGWPSAISSLHLSKESQGAVQGSKTLIDSYLDLPFIFGEGKIGSTYQFDHKFFIMQASIPVILGMSKGRCCRTGHITSAGLSLGRARSLSHLCWTSTQRIALQATKPAN